MTGDSTDVDFFLCDGCERNCRIITKKDRGEPNCCPFGILLSSGTIEKVTAPSGYTSENVDHPTHYGGRGNPYETIKVIEALGWVDNFCKGNAMKYLMRAGKKDPEREVEDLEKAVFYLNYLIEILKSKK